MKIPQRRCEGCRKMYDKPTLIRITKDAGNTPAIDLAGKSPGRGAYVCRNTECIQKAKKSKGAERSLKCVQRPELYDELKAAAER